MSRVITFSRFFPKGHPKAGERTLFPAKINESLLALGTYDITDEQLQVGFMDGDFTRYEVPCKWHTIRAGNRWKVGDKFSPRVWSGKPYASKQITIAPDIEIKKIWDIKFVTEDDDGHSDWMYIQAFGKIYTFYGYGGYDAEQIKMIAKNDGLSIEDFHDWMCPDVSGRKDRRHTQVVKSCQILCWSESIEYT